jgi:hypothetical protein
VDYYSLWSRRIKEKGKEINRMMGDMHGNIGRVLDESALEGMVYGMELKSAPKRLSLGAVDGGEGLKELSGVTVYMIRASGFFIKGGGEFIRDLDLGVIRLDRQTKAKVQFMRATMEYNVARELAHKFKPDYLLIDGSLLVGVEIDPIRINEYRLYIASLRALIESCEKLGVQLVGVSEDSASRGLIAYLSEKSHLDRKIASVLSSLTDASLIQFYIQNKLLKQGKKFECLATRQFLPVSDKGRDWIKKHTGIDRDFPTFYLQATKFGRSLRVDYPTDGKTDDRKAEKLASLLASLSQTPKRYGYPSPLFLAHQDAELPRSLMDKTSLLIEKQIFKSFRDEYISIYARKRRDSRPVDFG